MKRTKVLHIISSLNCGGAETMIMNIYRNIDREKIEFHFLCLKDIEGKYEKEVKQLGGTIYKVLPSENKLKKIYDIIKNNNYDAIHSHVMFYSGFIQFLAKRAGVKIRISHSHSSNDIKKETIIRKIYMLLMRSLINKYTNVKISCGEKAGVYLYGKKQKYIILKNGIDLDKFINVTNDEVKKLRKELQIEEDDFVIGHVGSFLEVKNQEYFIELAKELVLENEKFKIVLVGEGKKFEYITELIKKEGMEKYFIMPGVRDDIQVFMNMFDIFVMPSLYEGFPLVVVEALAGNNICYLSNRIPKETNIIESRVYFFDLNDSKRKLIRDIKEKVKYKQEVNLKDKLIEQGFSIRKMTEIISNIYEQ